MPWWPALICDKSNPLFFKEYNELQDVLKADADWILILLVHLNRLCFIKANGIRPWDKLSSRVFELGNNVTSLNPYQGELDAATKGDLETAIQMVKDARVKSSKYVSQSRPRRSTAGRPRKSFLPEQRPTLVALELSYDATVDMIKKSYEAHITYLKGPGKVFLEQQAQTKQLRRWTEVNYQNYQLQLLDKTAIGWGRFGDSIPITHPRQFLDFYDNPKQECEMEGLNEDLVFVWDFCNTFVEFIGHVPFTPETLINSMQQTKQIPSFSIYIDICLRLVHLLKGNYASVSPAWSCVDGKLFCPYNQTRISIVAIEENIRSLLLLERPEGRYQCSVSPSTLRTHTIMELAYLDKVSILRFLTEEYMHSQIGTKHIQSQVIMRHEHVAQGLFRVNALSKFFVTSVWQGSDVNEQDLLDTLKEIQLVLGDAVGFSDMSRKHLAQRQANLRVKLTNEDANLQGQDLLAVQRLREANSLEDIQSAIDDAQYLPGLQGQGWRLSVLEKAYAREQKYVVSHQFSLSVDITSFHSQKVRSPCLGTSTARNAAYYWFASDPSRVYIENLTSKKYTFVDGVTGCVWLCEQLQATDPALSTLIKDLLTMQFHPIGFIPCVEYLQFRREGWSFSGDPRIGKRIDRYVNRRGILHGIIIARRALPWLPLCFRISYNDGSHEILENEDVNTLIQSQDKKTILGYQVPPGWIDSDHPLLWRQVVGSNGVVLLPGTIVCVSPEADKCRIVYEGGEEVELQSRQAIEDILVPVTTQHRHRLLHTCLFNTNITLNMELQACGEHLNSTSLARQTWEGGISFHEWKQKVGATSDLSELIGLLLVMEQSLVSVHPQSWPDARSRELWIFSVKESATKAMLCSMLFCFMDITLMGV